MTGPQPGKPPRPANSAILRQLRTIRGRVVAGIGLITATVVTVLATHATDAVLGSASKARFDPSHPFAVTVTHFSNADGIVFALPEPLASGPDRVAFLGGSYSDIDALRTFARQHDGAVVNRDDFTLTITQPHQWKVQLVNLELVDVTKAAPLHGADFHIYTQGGGPTPAVPVDVNLDHQHPAVLGDDGRPIFESGTFTLGSDDVLEFDVHVQCYRYAARWALRATYLDPQSKTRTIEIGETGTYPVGATPRADRFSITGQSPRYETVYQQTASGTVVDAGPGR